MRLAGLAAAALAASPGCAQDAPSAPPPAALGPTASVVRAIEQGDAAALERATMGSISNRLTAEARGSGLVRMSAAELIALTRGCTADDPTEPGAAVTDPGGVGFKCEGRQAADNPCNDVGYGLLIRPGPGFARVSVWPNDLWSRARCGEPRPPPPVRLAPRRPTQ